MMKAARQWRQRQREKDGRTGGATMKGKVVRQCREWRLEDDVSGGVKKGSGGTIGGLWLVTATKRG
jgi:hypothetical protein